MSGTPVTIYPNVTGERMQKTTEGLLAAGAWVLILGGLGYGYVWLNQCAEARVRDEWSRYAGSRDLEGFIRWRANL